MPTRSKRLRFAHRQQVSVIARVRWESFEKHLSDLIIRPHKGQFRRKVGQSYLQTSNGANIICNVCWRRNVPMGLSWRRRYLTGCLPCEFQNRQKASLLRCKNTPERAGCSLEVLLTWK